MAANHSTVPSDQELVVLIYRQMRVIAGPHQDLDDLAQIALERVLSARFEGRSKFSTFTYKLCYHVWKDHLRFKFRWNKRFVPGVEVEQVDEETPERTALGRQRTKRLMEILFRLPEKHRVVLHLHDLDGRSIEEISEIVDAPMNTVRSRLRDGRKKLSSMLSKDELLSSYQLPSRRGTP